MTKNRKELPLAARLEKSFELPLLIEELYAFNLLDVDRYNDFNYTPDSPIYNLLNKSLDVRTLAMNEKEIQSARENNIYESQGYRQYYLTRSITKNEPRSEDNSPVSAKTRMRRLKRDSSLYDPATDERNYGHLKEGLGPRLTNLIQSFPGNLCRVRLAALMPGQKIQPHRDYDPSYLLRVHIPILSNQENYIFFDIKGTVSKYRYPADGSAYFINAGYIHWVENLGASPRIHLLIDIEGQEALNGMHPLEPEA